MRDAEQPVRHLIEGTLRKDSSDDLIDFAKREIAGLVDAKGKLNYDQVYQVIELIHMSLGDDHV